MKSLALLILASALLAQNPAPRPAPARAPNSVRFGALDVFIDPNGQPLAAYQFELKVAAGDVKLVGVEGGEHSAFGRPPYYDAAALTRQRIVIAAFNTGADLPRTRTRVARLMIQVTGPTPPAYDATIQVAASPDAKPIQSTISVSETAGSEGASR
jgi:hypothetical protein